MSLLRLTTYMESERRINCMQPNQEVLETKYISWPAIHLAIIVVLGFHLLLLMVV